MIIHEAIVSRLAMIAKVKPRLSSEADRWDLYEIACGR
jgi:hypothetical protein